MTFHRILFVALLFVWTWLLLKPNPVPAIIADSLIGDVKYLLSKCVHFGSYAFLAWYGTLRTTPPRRRWVWIGLAVHGALTELGQYLGDEYFQTNRRGRVHDVFIDAAGIALGAWWRITATAAATGPQARLS